MAIDAKDPVVAAAAINDDRILISWDRDFNQQRFMQPRFSDLSRISMSGSEVHGATRMEAIFDIILFAFSRANGTPLTIRVGPSKIQLHV
jgi:predicted nuclease of predicted toxin-antitoxin system